MVKARDAITIRSSSVSSGNNSASNNNNDGGERSKKCQIIKRGGGGLTFRCYNALNLWYLIPARKTCIFINIINRRRTTNFFFCKLETAENRFLFCKGMSISVMFRYFFLRNLRYKHYLANSSVAMANLQPSASGCSN